MKFTAASIVTFIIFFGFSIQNTSAAPNKSHNHEGRVHSHVLPLTGIKHYHKHMHEGRAHIHPYSVEIGFKHSHNKTPRAKAWANAVKHEHGGRPHSHPLPISGIKHQHKHRHGGRTHIHPLPIDGASHFHQSNKNQSAQVTKGNTTKSLNLIQQASALLNSKPLTKSDALKTLALLPKKISTKTAPIINNKIDLRDKKYLQLLKVINNKKTINKQKVIKKPLTQTTALKTIKSKKNKRIQSTKTGPSSKQPSTHVAEGNRQFSLALRYENGTGVKQNFPQAVKWYLRSAKKGNTKAQFNLATLYEQGKGVARDIPQAISWYTKAANNGDANAQINLGNRYSQGTNVPKDIKEAAKWYKRAADQGNLQAKANLNYLIESNNGVIRR